ncbi:MAG: cobalamin-dependent protein [Desulfosalsimonadaceae bacterium]
MITEELYSRYLDLLLKGDRAECTRIVQDLLDKGIEIHVLYQDLFRESLYRVGELWEHNRITVAREHLATAITEGLLNLVYPRLFKKESRVQAKKAVISCAANEYHQIGGKMVADVFEMQGWDAHFLGANTPVADMLAHIQEVKPDLVGLSLAVSFNVPHLQSSIEQIRANFRDLDLLVGGQAFRREGTEFLNQYTATHYIRSLKRLEAEIGKIANN